MVHWSHPEKKKCTRADFSGLSGSISAPGSYIRPSPTEFPAYVAFQALLYRLHGILTSIGGGSEMVRLEQRALQ